MSVALATLTARLQALTPARNGAPADYSQLAQDAVAQLAQDVPAVRTATLAIVAGAATYSLPDDFLFLIELPGLAEMVMTGDTLVTAAGLVPVMGYGSDTADGIYEIGGGQITFAPTPTYTLNRPIRYAAGHVLDMTDSYPRMNENAARIALLYGQYLALMAQAAATAGDGWKYSIGDESVDKSGQAKGLRETAEGFLKQYQQAISGLRGRRS